MREYLSIYKVDDWHDDYGDCLFFHFPNFEEPPEVIVTNPVSSDWDDKYTHFAMIDFNFVFEQAGYQAKGGLKLPEVSVLVNCGKPVE